MRINPLLTAAFLLLIGCNTLADKHRYLQCVPYARNVSGIEIYGNAHTWWDKSLKQYSRGNTPKKGSVLVLSKTKKLEYGHVAVVKKVVSKRQIEVAHANWGQDIIGRGAIYEAMTVRDVSKNNDWSRVRFWSPESKNFGMTYPAKGFVYKYRPAKSQKSTAAQDGKTSPSS